MREAFSSLRFNLYKADLEQAILDLSRETGRRESFREFKQDLKRVAEYGRPNSRPHFERYSFMSDDTETTTELPKVDLVPPPVPRPSRPVSVTGASHAGLSLKAMMEKHKARIASMLEDNLGKVQAGFDKQMQGATAVGTLGDKVNAEGDDLLAAVGQFTNDLGLE